MKPGVAKAAFGALALGGLLAGCATTVDMGGPLGHYRYHYDSRVVYDTSPAVVYREPTLTYHEPVVTYSAPAVTTYRAPTVTYSEPAVVYRYGTTVRDDD